jgi:hypothetical protein
MMKGMVLKPPFLGFDGCSVSLWFEGAPMLSSIAGFVSAPSFLCDPNERGRERFEDHSMGWNLHLLFLSFLLGGGGGGVLGPGPWLYQLHASFDSVACGNVLPVHYLCGFFTYFYCTISLLWDLEFSV